jgi:hypothetical protein
MCVNYPAKILSLQVNNIEIPIGCNNNDLLFSKISSTCFGQFLPIFRSVRLRFTACGIVSWCCGRFGSGQRQRDTMCKNCPKHVELILEISKSLLLHVVGLSTLFTYIDDARSNTNQIYLVYKPKVRMDNVNLYNQCPISIEHWLR